MAVAARRTAQVLLLALVAAFAVQLNATRTAPASAVATYRVLITGDSITQGSSGDYTWRYRLWHKLTSTAPGAVSFVGARTDLYDNVNSRQGSQAYAVDFPAKAHSALWGDSYQAELSKIGAEVAATTPNVLVVMLGSNDLTYFTSPEQTIANLKTYIERARAAAPGLDVVVGEALNKWDPWAGEYQLRDQVSEYATRLATLAGQLNTAHERVVVAPTRTGWDSRTMAWDGTHPNPTGEALIAQRISEGLAKIGVGTASPDVSGPQAWSVAGPTPSVSAGVEKATLSWDRTRSGATGMFIEQRLTNTHGAWTRLPYAVAGDSWTDELLAAGGTYEFRLVPSKGFSVGIAGPVASTKVGGTTPGPIATVTPSALGASSQGGQKGAAAWAPSDAAQGYLVSVRIAQDATLPWDDLPYPVSARSWTFEPLFPGRRYQFRVRGSRGFLTGPWAESSAVRIHGIAGDFAHAELGDSYSSGLGASGTYTGGDCLRSSNAWVHFVYSYYRGPETHLACAGAVVAGVRSQISAMNSFFAKNPNRAQLITLTVGGNDVGFTTILTDCVLGNCEGDEVAAHNRITRTGDTLAGLYAELRAARPYADIIVGGYPNVIERNGDSVNPLCLSIDDPERGMIDRLATHLDNVIVDEAANSHVWTATRQVEYGFLGHNACSHDAEWIHAGTLGSLGDPGLVGKQSFHPNDAGQYSYTESFNNAWKEQAG